MSEMSSLPLIPFPPHHLHFVMLWCIGYHYCITSFSKAWNQVLWRLKSCLQHIRALQWWGSLTVVPAGNKAECLIRVNHATKMIQNFFKITIYLINFNWGGVEETLSAFIHLKTVVFIFIFCNFGFCSSSLML